VQKALEDTHLKLASVVTTILGQSARALVDALVAGETDPLVLAHLAQGRLQDGCRTAAGRLRAKREALQMALVGTLKPQQRFLIAEHLTPSDQVDGAIARVDQDSAAHRQPAAEALAVLDPIPGLSPRAAEGIRAPDRD
jgi:transposase